MRNQSRRYAPEWLERKLSPSSLIATPVAVEVQVTSSVTTIPLLPTTRPFRRDPTTPSPRRRPIRAARPAPPKDSDRWRRVTFCGRRLSPGEPSLPG
jgi:hypothetical protein